MVIKSLDQLKTISKKIADNLSENDCIFLIGEIGVGKTTFSRCLINYLQKKKGMHETEVLSPTFNLLYEYSIKNLKIMHYDLYRIESKGELAQLGIFNEDEKTIKIIEWPELIKNNLPNKLELYFKYTKNELEREITFQGKGKWENFEFNAI